MRGATCLLTLLALAACAAQPASQSTRTLPHQRSGTAVPAPPGATPSPAAVDLLNQQAGRAAQLYRDQQYTQADTLLMTVTAATEFSALPAAQQHAVLELAGVTAMQMRDSRRGLALLQRACDLSEATGLDWFMRVQAADAAADEADTVRALAVLAVRWPDMLPRLEQTHDLDYAMRSVEKLGSDADRYAVLAALFSVHLSKWHPDESSWWRDLALLQLARGEREAAAGSVSRVNDAYTAISIDDDHRFDSIRGLLDSWPGIAVAAGRAIDDAARRARDDPGELEPMTRLAGLLGDSLRFTDELRVTDAAIDRAEADGPQAYSDYSSRYARILNDRADALYGLGRWDAALIQLKAASQLPEGATPNVSQVINLAAMYVELGRPTESRAALAEVQPRPVTPYGEMQKRLVALLAAVQLHDVQTANEALAFMRQHREDAPAALQQGLFLSGHGDEAARLLISRLTDPRLRSDALLAVQQYDAAAEPPWLQEKQRLWAALVARRDVQAAIGRVGRVDHYPLYQPGY